MHIDDIHVAEHVCDARAVSGIKVPGRGHNGEQEWLLVTDLTAEGQFAAFAQAVE